MNAPTTSIRLPPELRQRLEDTARRLQRGKNWIIVQALQQYLDIVDDQNLAQEAKRQSRLASTVTTSDESFWEKYGDNTGWQE